MIENLQEGSKHAKASMLAGQEKVKSCVDMTVKSGDIMTQTFESINGNDSEAASRAALGKPSP